MFAGTLFHRAFAHDRRVIEYNPNGGVIMKQHASTLNTVLAALFAALICAATTLVRIPLPGGGGYANLGDGAILLAAFLLNPPQAALASGLGAALADVLAGYPAYAPCTMIVKALMALAAARMCNRSRALAGILAESIMIAGYFIYESALLGLGAGALAGIPGNIGQGIVGIAAACAVAPVLTGRLRRNFHAS